MFPNASLAELCCQKFPPLCFFPNGGDFTTHVDYEYWHRRGFQPVFIWHSLFYSKGNLAACGITYKLKKDMEAKNLIGGLLVGAAVGITAGLLLAPRSGERTKKKLMKGSVKLKKDVVSYIDGSLEDLRSQFNDKIDKLARRSKETINHVSDRVKV